MIAATTNWGPLLALLALAVPVLVAVLVWRPLRYDCGREGCEIRHNSYHRHEEPAAETLRSGVGGD